jgi:hypothetical protein
MRSTRTILFGLFHCRDFVGKAPKEQRRHDTAPHFGHDIKHGKGPVADNRQWRGKIGWQHRGYSINSSVWVQHDSVGIDEQSKRSKKHQERYDTGIKDILEFHRIAHFAIQSSESLFGSSVWNHHNVRSARGRENTESLHTHTRIRTMATGKLT